MEKIPTLRIKLTEGDNARWLQLTGRNDRMLKETQYLSGGNARLTT